MNGKVKEGLHGNMSNGNGDNIRAGHTISPVINLTTMDFIADPSGPVNPAGSPGPFADLNSINNNHGYGFKLHGIANTPAASHGFLDGILVPSAFSQSTTLPNTHCDAANATTEEELTSQKLYLDNYPHEKTPEMLRLLEQTNKALEQKQRERLMMIDPHLLLKQPAAATVSTEGRQAEGGVTTATIHQHPSPAPCTFGQNNPQMGNTGSQYEKNAHTSDYQAQSIQARGSTDPIQTQASNTLVNNVLKSGHFVDEFEALFNQGKQITKKQVNNKQRIIKKHITNKQVANQKQSGRQGMNNRAMMPPPHRPVPMTPKPRTTITAASAVAPTPAPVATVPKLAPLPKFGVFKLKPNKTKPKSTPTVMQCAPISISANREEKRPKLYVDQDGNHQVFLPKGEDPNKPVKLSEFVRHARDEQLASVALRDGKLDDSSSPAVTTTTAGTKKRMRPDYLLIEKDMEEGERCRRTWHNLSTSVADRHGRRERNNASARKSREKTRNTIQTQAETIEAQEEKIQEQETLIAVLREEISRLQKQQEGGYDDGDYGLGALAEYL